MNASDKPGKIGADNAAATGWIKPTLEKLPLDGALTGGGPDIVAADGLSGYPDLS